ncbi:SDR family NAD(P)-dependent oxidoreductase [Luteolibacter sp. AS25]|uniref:SDR family NAD(P)-dependent oxidoreductase n=1 Tax=Luteolibacter sp. AS25 TaxID=3135776 RepID=UPI00398A9ACD
MISGVKRAIITGGTGGLGSAISQKLRSEGWETISLGRSDLALSDSAAVKKFFDANPCDLLICAAGAIRDRPILKMDEEDWDDVFELNFTAAERCARAVVRPMKKNEGGQIIFISSYAAVHPAVGQAAYAAAKAGLVGLAKDMAEEFGANGIRFNVVAPGFLETPMTEAVSGKRKEIVRDLHFLKKFNSVEAAADFIWFLADRMPMTSGRFFELDSRP